MHPARELGLDHKPIPDVRIPDLRESQLDLIPKCSGRLIPRIQHVLLEHQARALRVGNEDDRARVGVEVEMGTRRNQVPRDRPANAYPGQVTETDNELELLPESLG